jgi:hypothetical protein
VYDTHEFNPKPDLPREFERGPETRFLTLGDLPRLLELECQKWDDDQAASRDDLQARIGAYPDFSVVAFCPHSGELLASLFLSPVAADFWR